MFSGVRTGARNEVKMNRDERDSFADMLQELARMVDELMDAIRDGQPAVVVSYLASKVDIEIHQQRRDRGFLFEKNDSHYGVPID